MIASPKDLIPPSLYMMNHSYIRSFHSSALLAREYSPNAERLYSPFIPSGTQNRFGRVWAVPLL